MLKNAGALTVKTNHELEGTILFDLLTTDGDARRGQLTLPHGTVQTPVFQPCGPRACDIVAKYISIISRVLSKAKLN